jgi:hypothetical protein
MFYIDEQKPIGWVIGNELACEINRTQKTFPVRSLLMQVFLLFAGKLSGRCTVVRLMSEGHALP